jgi:hypothetical protein
MDSKTIPWLLKVAEEWKIDRWVHCGDVVNWGAISYHRSYLSEFTPKQELRRARKQVAELHAAIGKADVMVGNHDCLPSRRMTDVGLDADELLRPYAELWETPKWTWHDRYEDLIIDGSAFRHGDKGRGGKYNSAYLNVQDEHISITQGHWHLQCCTNRVPIKRTKFFAS